MPDPAAFLPELVTGGGLTGVLVWLLFALTTGRLWTGGQVKLVLAARDRQIDDLRGQRDDWRDTARTDGRRADILAGNQEKTIQLLEAMAGRTGARGG